MLLGVLLLAVAPISNAEQAAVRMAAERLTREPAGTRWELRTVMPALRGRVAVFTVTDAKGAEETVLFENGSFRALSQPAERKPFSFSAAAPPPAPVRDRKPLALALLAAALTAAAALLPRQAQPAMLAAAAALVATSTWKSLEGRAPPAHHAGRMSVPQRRSNGWPGRDATWIEAANALMAQGYEDRAKAYYERLARIGSREADVYYSLAMLAGTEEEQDSWLRQAWSLRPVERKRLIAFANRAGVAKLIQLSAATEPLVRSPNASTQPIPLPPNAKASLSGEFLRVQIGANELLVPGGAALAPPGTPVVAATPAKIQPDRATELMELAEQLAAKDQFDAAVKVYDRAQRIRPNAIIDERVRQIRMSQRLATKYYVTKTPHFDIHYPPDVSATAAATLGEVLEAELGRLQDWIPSPRFQRVVVNVVWWQEFRGIYTGSDAILGLYNGGKITVPVAGVRELTPPVVAILAHELAHAMIAQATNDRAPRWFHEGLAQHIEERPHFDNAFLMYDDERLLPVALLDAVLQDSPDPEMIKEAYIVAETDVRFIESRYGRAGLRRMLRAFRDGRTTDEALPKQFDSELHAWGRAQ